MKNALVIAALLLLLPVTAEAFGTLEIQGAEHERITRLALSSFGIQPNTMSEIAGKKGSFGAVGAPDRPGRGLITVSDAHCDNGDYFDIPGYPQSIQQANQHFIRCREWLVRNFQAAIDAANGLVDQNGRVKDSEIPTFVSCSYNGHPGRAKCNVMEALGLVFHTAEDFYSHSNWVDQPAPGPITPLNPPGLGNDGRAPFMDPSIANPVFPVGLISGCFVLIPEKAFCSYDGGKPRIRHEVLDKDEGDINISTGAIGAGTTTRGAVNDNFARAVKAAIDDTKAKWALLEQSLVVKYGAKRGNAMICAMRMDNPAKSCP